MDLQGQTLPNGILLEHLRAFQNLYREHCEVSSCQDDHISIFHGFCSFLIANSMFLSEAMLFAVHIIKLFTLFKIYIIYLVNINI